MSDGAAVLAHKFCVPRRASAVPITEAATALFSTVSAIEVRCHYCGRTMAGCGLERCSLVLEEEPVFRPSFGPVPRRD